MAANPGAIEWDREPLVPVNNDQENRFVGRPAGEWCTCGCCQNQDCAEMEICCKDHPIWQTRDGDEENLRCIHESRNIQQLLQPAPLRMMYFNFCAYHAPMYPDAELLQPNDQLDETEISRLKNRQKRLCAYRSLVFWAYPHIRKRERRPLPACLYDYIRTLFPPTENEEAFADHQFTVFTANVDNI